ncbi:hypothetical protein M5K25_025311 [Dendrobium thyrsiflorum]|uniref:Uncharacterized protein n=1 Tax=Dendrobium thyrsiflorum TaxID=117978 RepID=A0ABD0U433_DENTH
MANAKKARKDIAMEPLILSVNLSLPNMEIQSSLRAAADDEADIRRNPDSTRIPFIPPRPTFADIVAGGAAILFTMSSFSGDLPVCNIGLPASSSFDWWCVETTVSSPPGKGAWFSNRRTGDRSGESREFSFGNRSGEFTAGASLNLPIGGGGICSSGSRKRERGGNPNDFVKCTSFPLELVFCRGPREAIPAAAAAAATAADCSGGEPSFSCLSGNWPGDLLIALSLSLSRPRSCSRWLSRLRCGF